MNERLWDDYGYGNRRSAVVRVRELSAACNDSASVCRTGLVCREPAALGLTRVHDAIDEHVWRLGLERGGL